MNDIKSLRKHYALTQQTMASIIGVHQIEISRWETGAVKLNKYKLDGYISELEKHNKR